MYMLVKNDVNLRENMVGTRSEYKRVLRKSRYDNRKSKTQQLDESCFENVTSYWKLLKKLCQSNSPKTLKSQHFANYLKLKIIRTVDFYKLMKMYYCIMKDMFKGN